MDSGLISKILRYCEEIGATGVITHPSYDREFKGSIFIENIKYILEKFNEIVLIENMKGGGVADVYYFLIIKNHFGRKVGLCLDISLAITFYDFETVLEFISNSLAMHFHLSDTAKNKNGFVCHFPLGFRFFRDLEKLEKVIEKIEDRTATLDVFFSAGLSNPFEISLKYLNRVLKGTS